MAALRAGDADLAAPAGHAQLLAALGAAVIVIVLALLEPHLLLAKPRGNAVLVGEIFEVFTVPLAGVAAQNAEIAVDDGRQPQPVQHRRHPRADDNKDKRRNTQETAELVEPISAKPHCFHRTIMAHKYGQIVNKRGIEFEQKLDLISIYMCYRYIDFFQRNHFFVFFTKVIIIL